MFGIWDIFYYVFLKVFLDWPAINSDMGCAVFRTGALGQPSACANYMFFDHDRIWMHYGASTTERRTLKIKGVDWALFISGAAVIFYSFIKDYVTFLLSEGLPINIWALARNPNFQQLISQYVPTHYSWYLFFVGELLMLIGMFHVFRCAQPKR